MYLNPSIYKLKDGFSFILNTGISTYEKITCSIMSEDCIGLDVHIVTEPSGTKHSTDRVSKYFASSTEPSVVDTVTKSTVVGSQILQTSGTISCNHQCRDKDSCKHTCCKNGVAVKSRKRKAENLSSVNSKSLTNANRMLNDSAAAEFESYDPIDFAVIDKLCESSVNQIDDDYLQEFDDIDFQENDGFFETGQHLKPANVRKVDTKAQIFSTVTPLLTSCDFDDDFQSTQNYQHIVTPRSFKSLVSDQKQNLNSTNKKKYPDCGLVEQARNQMQDLHSKIVANVPKTTKDHDLPLHQTSSTLPYPSQTEELAPFMNKASRITTQPPRDKHVSVFGVVKQMRVDHGPDFEDVQCMSGLFDDMF